MAETTSDTIIAECAMAFENNSEDCNKYLKAVSAVFFEPDLFTGVGMNADAIVAELRRSKEWTGLGTSHAAAIRNARTGQFVIAGMTSRELDSAHGHLAVIIGKDGQLSGTVVVPLCYAGSLNTTARVQGKRVSETFGATFARESRISYFSRTPQTVPTDSPVNRLVDFINGVRAAPELSRVPKARARRPK